MKPEKYSPKWLLEKIESTSYKARKLMYIVEFQQELKKEAINYSQCCKSDSEQLNHDLKVGDDVYIVSKKLVEVYDIHPNGKIIQVKDGLETYPVDSDELEKVV